MMRIFLAQLLGILVLSVVPKFILVLKAAFFFWMSWIVLCTNFDLILFTCLMWSDSDDTMDNNKIVVALSNKIMSQFYLNLDGSRHDLVCRYIQNYKMFLHPLLDGESSTTSY
jgi:hypothetical protein